MICRWSLDSVLLVALRVCVVFPWVQCTIHYQKKKNATYSYIFCSRVCKICGYSHLIASFETNTAKAIYL